MKRAVNRLLARLAMFVIAIVLGAIAVSQAQKGIEARRAGTGEASLPQVVDAPAITPEPVQPIPFTEVDDALPPPATFADQSVETVEIPPMESSYEAAPPNEEPLEYAAPPARIAAANDYAVDTDYAAAPDYGSAESAPADYGTADYGTGDYAEPDFASNQASGEMSDPGANDSQPPPYDEYAAAPPQAEYSAPIMQVPETAAGPTTDFPVDEYSAPPVASQLPATPDFAPSAPAAFEQPATSQSSPANDYNDQYAQAQYTGAANLNVARNEGSGRERYPAPGSLAASDDSALGNGKPGPAELEGPQTPTLTVSKTSPKEVQVGKTARFHVTVRNVGQVPAQDVLIRDEVPHGARLVDTNPPAGRAADGGILWQMGTLKPGGEVTVTMDIMPIDEGDIGSVATVSFQTAASAKAISTRPQLVLEHSTAREVLVGQDVIFNIKLSNPGTGAATNVIIEEDVPEGLRHFDGRELEYQVGTIRPGETRLLELALKADKPGLVNNRLIARAEANLEVEDYCELEVVAPLLQVAITGPRKRYLERKANYELTVGNPGTAAARNVEIIANLPRALKFVSTNNAGNYDAQRHAVVWSLQELPPKEMGTVALVTVPTQMGDHRIRVDAQADMGLTHSVEHDVSVDGLAALLFTVTDVSDPIEVGGQTTYEVHVVNQGSKTATNLRIAALVPAGMSAINGEGPTRAAINGARVLFDPLPRLAPQADTFYKVHVKGNQPGDKRIQVKLMSDELSEPVTKEESTHVYADE